MNRGMDRKSIIVSQTLSRRTTLLGHDEINSRVTRSPHQLIWRHCNVETERTLNRRNKCSV